MFGWRSAREKDRTEMDRDLGFGAVVASRSAARLLNRDGSFNSRREGLGFFASLHLYDALLTMSWPRFLSLVVLAYLTGNALFGLAYTALGEGSLEGGPHSSWSERLYQGFTFSVHTLSTVGYGSIVPSSVAANVLMTLQSIVGLIAIALTTGIVFARFSRPTAKILFSERAVVAPYRDGLGLMFRIANRRSTQILELEAQVMFSRMEREEGKTQRRFYRLPLERDKVAFFALAWTVVHPIDENSPFHHLSTDECTSSDAEILILLKGIDETFSQTVHARSSYKGDEVVWDAKFSDIFLRNENGGIVGMDLGRLSEIERLTPEAALDPKG